MCGFNLPWLNSRVGPADSELDGPMDGHLYARLDVALIWILININFRSCICQETLVMFLISHSHSSRSRNGRSKSDFVSMCFLIKQLSKQKVPQIELRSRFIYIYILYSYTSHKPRIYGQPSDIAYCPLLYGLNMVLRYVCISSHIFPLLVIFSL